MLRLKRWVSALLTASLLLGIAAGCQEDTDPGGEDTTTVTTTAATTDSEGEEPEDTETTDTQGTEEAAGNLEEMTINMYLIGDRAPDFDEVYDAVNEILTEEVNATVNVEFLSWGEHDTKYSLLFSSQEDFDLIFTASSWGHYETTTALGGFAPLTREFLEEYAPEILRDVPEIAWEQARKQGQPYMVPNNQTEFSQDVMAVRGDLMDEWGIEDITNWDELVHFFETAAENGMYASQGGPTYQHFQDRGFSTTGGAPKSGELVLYNTQDPEDLELYYVLDWEGFTEYVHTVKDLADKGAWSRDVLNDPADRQTGLLTGRAASMVWNLGSTVLYGNQANAENPDWNVRIVDPVSQHPKKVNPYTNNGIAIHAASDKKERAMMVLNQFYTNPAIQDLTQLGIEGKHWEAVGDDEYKLLEQEGYVANNNSNWGWTNDNIRRTVFTEDPTPIDLQAEEMEANWVENIKEPHPYDGFSFDNSAVSSQAAAVESNIATYFDPLVNGLVEDVDASLEAFRNALETAGIRDILEEMQRQADEFVQQN